ncbi:MAG: hypothetical protein B6244_08025 [Candidatus Cloacimonetes bacterium 4572_55]|nr:MAG: hypothetical protein B6244_08025 [Candidatus Cloacimonetes bacterium 4572_55]
MFYFKIILILFFLIVGALFFSTPSQGKKKDRFEGDDDFKNENYVAALKSYRNQLEGIHNTEKRLHLRYKIGQCLQKLSQEEDYQEELNTFLESYSEESAGTIWEARAYLMKGSRRYYYNEKSSIEQARVIFEKYRNSGELWKGELSEVDSILAAILEKNMSGYYFPESNGADSFDKEIDHARIEKESLVMEKGAYDPEWEIRKRILFLYREMEQLAENVDGKFSERYFLGHFLRRQARTDIYRDEALKTLRDVIDEAPDRKMRQDAQYSLVLYYQEQNDLVACMKEIENLQRDFPDSRWVSDTKAIAQDIAKKELRLEIETVFLPGHTPEFSIQSRNLKEETLSLYRFDLVRLMNNHRGNIDVGDLRKFCFTSNIEDAMAYTTGLELKYQLTVEDKGDYQPVTVDEVLTLSEPLPIGAYLLVIEGGKIQAAALFTVSDLAIIQRTTAHKSVVYVAHAVTGEPESDARAVVIQNKNFHEGTTDAQGIFQVELTQDTDSYDHIACFGYIGDRIALLPEAYHYKRYRGEREIKSYTITDRPVYRPDQILYFKHIFRENFEGVFHALTDRKIDVQIRNPKGETVLDTALVTNEFGSISGSYHIPADAALGQFYFQIHIDGDSPDDMSGRYFRVEEYKRPEVKLSIILDGENLRVDATAQATLKAEYYFGGPVANAEVSYHVRRRDYQPIFYAQRDYDWLYGKGFAEDHAENQSGWDGIWYDWNSAEIMSGEETTDEKGEVVLKIPTADLLSDDWDGAYKLTIEASVTDKSRRKIDTKKQFVLPTQDFYAFLQTERNFLIPNEKVTFEIHTLSPNHEPYNVQGEIILFELTSRPSKKDKVAEDEDPYIEKKILSKKLSTENGQANWVWRPKTDGHYRIKFRALDSYEKEVVAETDLWVAGEKFSGSTYRFLGMTVTTDKSEYAEGETAHLLLTVEQKNSHIFLTTTGDDALDAHVIHVPNRAKIIPLKIGTQHTPNFFINGYVILNGKVLTDHVQVFVPPKRHFITVQTQADKEVYRPGEDGHLTIRTTDYEGNPISSEVGVSMFDASLLYIQPNINPDIRTFFYGHLHRDDTETGASFDYSMAATVEDDQKYGTFKRHDHPDGFDQIYGLYLKSMSAVPLLALEAGSVPDNMRMEGDRDEAEPVNESNKEENAPDFKPEIRNDFSETALWRPFAVTGKSGVATVDFQLPDALTTWRAEAKAVTKKTQVGEDKIEVRTQKRIMARLQAPRFFVEKDEAVISANLHNYTETRQDLSVKLELEGGTLEPFADVELQISTSLDPKSEARIDWRVKVVRGGEATVRVIAAGKNDGDAVEMHFPTIPYGIEKMVAYSDDMSDRDHLEFTITVPDEIRSGSQNLSMVLSPSLAAIAIDALPYLADYPYGCFEQTLSRFVPAALTAKTLDDLGVNLEDLRKARKNIIADKLIAKQYHSHRKSPLYDSEELQKMIRAGLNKIAKFQKSDGGFGWWSHDHSSDPYMTAQGVNSLILAKSCDLSFNDGMIEQAVRFLTKYIKNVHNKDINKINLNLNAYILYSISNYDPGLVDLAMLDKFYQFRDEMSYYSWALMGLTYTNIVLNQMGQFKSGGLSPASLDPPLIDQPMKSATYGRMKGIYENLLDRIRTDEENDTAYWKPEGGYWWFWWNDRIETTATALQFLNRIDPKNERLPQIVKWLVNNRRGNSWYSTKDTALAVHVLLEYARLHGELDADYSLTVKMDEKELKNFIITPQTFFSFDNKLFIDDEGLTAGDHRIEIIKEGQGNLYYSAFVEYFTKEDPIQAVGNEIFIDRAYYKIQGNTQEDWQKLESGDQLLSGDEIEAILTINAKNDYEYLVFEDMKPAGCEFKQLRSIGGYMELRDEKVVFFRHWIRQGETEIRYRLRAEVPGMFHALPTHGRCMYAPDVRGISDSFVIKVAD